jgi:hypothetical protein
VEIETTGGCYYARAGTHYVIAPGRIDAAAAAGILGDYEVLRPAQPLEPWLTIMVDEPTSLTHEALKILESGGVKVHSRSELMPPVDLSEIRAMLRDQSEAESAPD